MATATAPSATTGGVSASIWASQSAPARTGPSREPSSGSRGTARGGHRGRGSRGGRGGRGGRPGNGSSSAIDAESTAKKTNSDSSRDKAPSTASKLDSSPAPSEPSSSIQPKTISKATSRPQHPRKASDASRKSSLKVETPVSPASVVPPSPSLPSGNAHRRKRSQAQNKLPLPPPSFLGGHVRKQSVASDKGSSSVEKPSAVSSKDAPPHMAPPSAVTRESDLAHNIDALVERVRAVAMDRPHSPGSHFDWAGDEDDSLPDLDDWGVTSSLSTTGPITEGPGSDVVSVSVISPILQDTLKPLPSITDIDLPTPSIKLHEANEAEPIANTQVISDVEDTTPRSVTGDATPSDNPIAAKSATANDSPVLEVLNDGHEHNAEQSSKASHSPIVAPSSFSDHHPVPAKPSARPQSADFSFKSSSSERGLSASIHAMSPSTATATHLQPRNAPQSHRDGFNPSHSRTHTFGRFKNDSHSDSDRPRRGGDFSHGRNHSTPPTGLGTNPSHARAPHATRPVISGDAITRLARTLGGTSASKRGREPTDVNAPSMN